MHRHCHILQIDDNPHDLAWTEEALEQVTGGSVHYTGISDPAAALRFLQGGGIPLPHAILLDLRMPCLDGLSLLRAIRGDPRLAAMPVFVLTGLVDPDQERTCLAIGATACLAKGSSFRELVEAVSAIRRWC